MAEDGTIDARYILKETPSSDYPQRIEWSVRDSDATVVFSIAPVLTGGSKKTVDFAYEHNKPVLHISRQGGPASPEQALLRFVQEHAIKVLNVAGPRASKEPEVYGFVKEVLASDGFLVRSPVADLEHHNARICIDDRAGQRFSQRVQALTAALDAGNRRQASRAAGRTFGPIHTQYLTDFGGA